LTLSPPVEPNSQPVHTSGKPVWNIYTFFSTLLGLGFVPFMPGTFGTFAAAALYLAIPEQYFTVFPYLLYLMLPLVLLFFAGVYLTKKAEQVLGHDAGSIIIDELVGYFVAVLFLPQSLLMAVYTFAIFRVFDIAKPYPIKKLQLLPHGWGIMADDVLAGIYTNVFMQILLRLYPKFFIN
jgi:phosphatidylglycerophosphatase A